MVITGGMGGIIRQNRTDEQEEQGDTVHVGQPPHRRYVENVNELEDNISAEEAWLYQAPGSLKNLFFNIFLNLFEIFFAEEQ
jgi:hypothetical protein